MRMYIKPEISITEMESQTLLAGSLNRNGTQGGLQQGGSGTQGASGARAKGHNFESLWDESWDTPEDDDDEQ